MLRVNDIVSLGTQSLFLVLIGSLPAILAAAVAGVIISLVQALTQVQDQGLPTAAKFFSVVLILFLTYQATASSLTTFFLTLFRLIKDI